MKYSQLSLDIRKNPEKYISPKNMVSGIPGLYRYTHYIISAEGGLSNLSKYYCGVNSYDKKRAGKNDPITIWTHQVDMANTYKTSQSAINSIIKHRDIDIYDGFTVNSFAFKRGNIPSIMKPVFTVEAVIWTFNTNTEKPAITLSAKVLRDKYIDIDKEQESGKFMII